jgi:Ni/Co efflux regulator RcnB
MKNVILILMTVVALIPAVSFALDGAQPAAAHKDDADRAQKRKERREKIKERRARRQERREKRKSAAQTPASAPTK